MSVLLIMEELHVLSVVALYRRLGKCCDGPVGAFELNVIK